MSSVGFILEHQAQLDTATRHFEQRLDKFFSTLHVYLFDKYVLNIC
jgi:hypothetical protein